MPALNDTTQYGSLFVNTIQARSAGLYDPTAADTAGARKSALTFYGKTAGDVEHAVCALEARTSSDATGNQKGMVSIQINKGSGGNDLSSSEALTINSSGHLKLYNDTNAGTLEVTSEGILKALASVQAPVLTAVSASGSGGSLVGTNASLTGTNDTGYSMLFNNTANTSSLAYTPSASTGLVLDAPKTTYTLNPGTFSVNHKLAGKTFVIDETTGVSTGYSVKANDQLLVRNYSATNQTATHYLQYDAADDGLRVSGPNSLLSVTNTSMSYGPAVFAASGTGASTFNGAVTVNAALEAGACTFDTVAVSGAMTAPSLTTTGAIGCASLLASGSVGGATLNASGLATVGSLLSGSANFRKAVPSALLPADLSSLYSVRLNGGSDVAHNNGIAFTHGAVESEPSALPSCAIVSSRTSGVGGPGKLSFRALNTSASGCTERMLIDGAANLITCVDDVTLSKTLLVGGRTDMSGNLNVNTTDAIGNSSWCSAYPLIVAGLDASVNTVRCALAFAHNSNMTGLTPGSTMTFERKGSNSIGELAINMKPTTGATDALVKAFSIASNGNANFLANVGIGTTAPLTSLSITPALLGAKISLWDNGSATNHVGFGVSSTALNYHVEKSTVDHVFHMGGKNGDGTELMRIRGTGNVGIGIAAPTEKLHVGGNAKIDGTLTASGAATFSNTLTASGPATFNNTLTVNGNAAINGDLTITGTTTTLNSTTVDILDQAITLAKVASPTTTTANGAGIDIPVSASEYRSLKWLSAANEFNSNCNMGVATGYGFLIGGAPILSSSTLSLKSSDLVPANITMATEAGVDKWRMQLSGSDLVFQYWTGTEWVTKTQFTA